MNEDDEIDWNGDTIFIKNYPAKSKNFRVVVEFRRAPDGSEIDHRTWASVSIAALSIDSDPGKISRLCRSGKSYEGLYFRYATQDEKMKFLKGKIPDLPPFPVPVQLENQNRILRCEKFPDFLFSFKEAAQTAGVSTSYVNQSAWKKDHGSNPVGIHRLVFYRADVEEITASFTRQDAARKKDEQFYVDLEWAFCECGDEAHEICYGDGYVEGEKMNIAGINFRNNGDFHDVEHGVHCVVALMLHRNPLRSALFSACDEVIAKGLV